MVKKRVAYSVDTKNKAVEMKLVNGGLAPVGVMIAYKK